MTLQFSRVTVPPLWTVEEAKALQLGITDDRHDADVAQKLAAAHDAIIAYLAEAADPTWTPETAPHVVKQAIFLLLTHYWVHRGDDMNPSASGATPDADVWAGIDRLLQMHRDPTVR